MGTRCEHSSTDVAALKAKESSFNVKNFLHPCRPLAQDLMTFFCLASQENLRAPHFPQFVNSRMPQVLFEASSRPDDRQPTHVVWFLPAHQPGSPVDSAAKQCSLLGVFCCQGSPIRVLAALGVPAAVDGPGPAPGAVSVVTVGEAQGSLWDEASCLSQVWVVLLLCSSLHWSAFHPIRLGLESRQDRSECLPCFNFQLKNSEFPPNFLLPLKFCGGFAL